MPATVEQFESEFVRPCEGRTLICGSRLYVGRDDRRKLYANAEGWDKQGGEGVDRVVDLELIDNTKGEQFAHIDCISVLEHTPKPWAIATNLEWLLKPQGTLYLGVPFIWREHNYPADYWRFTIAGVRALFPSIAWQALRYVHTRITSEGEKISGAKIKEHPYFARTEVRAFGNKR